MATYRLEIIASGKDSGASSMLDNLGGSLKRIGEFAAGGLLAMGVAKVADLTAQVFEAGFSLNSLKEQAQVAFSTMFNDASMARSFIDELQDFAAHTPFEFPELLTAAKNLTAVGISAREVIPLMTTIGDATSAMGTGEFGIKRATLALQQMGTLGRVTAQDMLQLTQAGIPAWQALAAQMGMSVSDVQKRVSDGLVPAQTMFKALESGAGESLQRIKGMMAQQSQTFQGMFSTFKDNVSQLSATAMRPIFDLATKGLAQVNQVLSSDTVTKGAATFAKNFSSALTAIIAFITGTLLPALGAVGQYIQQTFGSSFAAAGDLIKNSILPAMASLSGWIQSNLMPVFMQFASWVTGTLLPTFNRFVTFLLGTILPGLIQFGSSIAPILGNGIMQIVSIFQTRLAPALAQFGGFLNTVVFSALQALGDWLGPKLVPILQAFVTLLVDHVVQGFDRFAQGLQSALSHVNEFAQAFGNAIQWIVERIADLLSAIADGFAAIGNMDMAAGIRNTVEGMRASFSELSNMVQIAIFDAKNYVEASGEVNTAAQTATDRVLSETDALRREQMDARNAAAASQAAADGFEQMGESGMTAGDNLKKMSDTLKQVADKVRGMVEQVLSPTSVEQRAKMTGNAWDEFRLRLQAVITGTSLDEYGADFVAQVQKMQEVTGLALPDIASKFQDFSLFANADWLKAALDVGAIDLSGITAQIDSMIDQIIGKANLVREAFSRIWDDMDFGKKIDLAKAMGLDVSGGVEQLRDQIQGALSGAMSGVTTANLPGTQGAQILGQATGVLEKNMSNLVGTVQNLTPLLQPLGEKFAPLNEKIKEINPQVEILKTNWSTFRNDTAALTDLLEIAKGRLIDLSAIIAGDATSAFSAFLNNVLIPIRDTFAEISSLLGDITKQVEALDALFRTIRAPEPLERHSPSPLEQALYMSVAHMKELRPLMADAFGGDAFPRGGGFGRIMPPSVVGAPATWANGSLTVRVDRPVVRKDSDIDAIADAVARKLGMDMIHRARGRN